MSKIFIILSMIVFLGGCFNKEESQNYQLISNNSQVYRLNSTTGEIVVFGKDGIQRYDDKYIDERYKNSSSLNTLKIENKKSFPESNGQMWTTLSYKWRNDKILYNYTFGPYSEILQNIFNNGYDHITLDFMDSDGFSVVSEKVNLSSFMRVVDNDGKLTHWSKEGEVPCSKDDYLIIIGYSTPWNFSQKSKIAISENSVVLKKEFEQLIGSVKSLISENKIQGKIEQNNVFIKKGNSFEQLENKDREYIKFIVENTDLLLFLQGPEDKAEPKNPNNS